VPGPVGDDAFFDTDDDRGPHRQTLRACRRHEPDGPGRPAESYVLADWLDLTEEPAKALLAVEDAVKVVEQRDGPFVSLAEDVRLFGEPATPASVAEVGCFEIDLVDQLKRQLDDAPDALSL
jgi:hypothetical protein